MALLTLNDLSCSRGGLIVLSGVNMSLSAGETKVLRGPNGSGKTTLLRTIARLQPPVAGEVLSDPDTVAYAAHADGVKGTLSVGENLEFWAGLFGTDTVEQALLAFDLSELRNRRAQALSAGQKRRLGLARLMVTGRPVWALDEPTVSLDAGSVALFVEAVRLHLAEGGAAVIATHIDFGIEAEVIDVSRFKPGEAETTAFYEAFL